MKQRDEITDLKELNAEQLTERLQSTQEELLKLRLRHASGQLEQTAQLRTLKKRIARIKTVQQEQRAAE